MRLWQKIVVGAAVSGGAYAAYRYLSGLQKTNAELQSEVSIVDVNASILEGATIQFNVKLKNPTAGSFSIKYPFVQFLYNDAVIGSSQSLDKNIQLPPYGEALIDKITITVPSLKILITGFDFIGTLLKGKAISVTARTLTTIDLGWKKLPYEKKEQATLKL